MINLLWVMCWLSAPLAHSNTNQYNIVLITADTLRADMLGANGNREVRTPHLDKLAASGINFSRAYTNITTTTPSHATLFSSLFPRDHKAYSNTAKISEDILTIDEILQKHGWYTSAIVNMPWLNPDMSNIMQGMDEVERCKHIRKANQTNPWVLSFLDRQKNTQRPFYLWIHYVDNHTPYHAPGRYQKMYYPKNRDPRSKKYTSLQRAWKFFPTHHQDEPTFKRWLAGITDVDYVIGLNKGSVSWLDYHVGEVITRLKKNDMWDKTIFVFTSDHGESLGEHSIWFAHSGLFETTARVPLILRIPGGPKGFKTDNLVQLADVMPTLLARVGINAPNDIRGRDIWPGLRKKDSTRAIFIEHAGAQMTAVVTKRYKYIKHLKTKNYNPGYLLRKGREELYDLRKDPKERSNLVSKDPKRLSFLRKELERLKNQKGTDHEAQKAEVDSETEEMLRSLGYTE